MRNWARAEAVSNMESWGEAQKRRADKLSDEVARLKRLVALMGGMAGGVDKDEALRNIARMAAEEANR